MVSILGLAAGYTPGVPRLPVHAGIDSRMLY
jgi:hypothetical protein